MTPMINFTFRPVAFYTVSVIIPCHNAAMELRRCLAALAAGQCCGAEYIIVDDGSTDDIDAVLSSASIPLTTIRTGARRGSAVARNRGALAACGDVLVFLDADTCVHPDTLPKIIAAFCSEPALGALIGAYDDQPSERNFYSQYRNLLHCYVHRTNSREACTFWTGCGAVWRDVFLAHGGFNESPGNVDDIEFGRELTRNGVRIDLRSDIQVTHQKRWTFYSVLKTDLLLRGIPWTKLIMRERRIPNALNVTYRNRATVALVSFTVLGCFVGLWRPEMRELSLACFCAVLWTNRSFYKFLLDRRGPEFVLLAVPAHLLHFVVCGLSFAIGSALFAFSEAQTAAARAQAIEADAD